MEAWTNVGVPLIVALLTSTALWGVVSKVILKRPDGGGYLRSVRQAERADRVQRGAVRKSKIIRKAVQYERGHFWDVSQL